MEHFQPGTRKFAKTLRKNMTDAEYRLWYHLKSRGLDGHHFRKQHPIGPYITDFACANARLIIEVDGGTHTSDEAMAHDKKRTAYLQQEGWHILRFWNDHIFKDIDSVLGEISDYISSTALAGEVAEAFCTNAEVGGGLPG